MTPIQSKAKPEFIYNFVHVSLDGNKEKKCKESNNITLSTAMDCVNNVMMDYTDLPKMEQEMLRTNLENFGFAEVQANKQAELKINHLQGNKLPEERVFVQKVYESYLGSSVGAHLRLKKLPRYIYERDDKQFENDKERQEWQARIELMNLAFSTRSLFSISIVPYDPDMHQTWYDKKSITQQLNTEIFFEETEDKQFDKSICYQKAVSTKPSEVFFGFFKPYFTFSSQLAGPQLDPEKLPGIVKKAYVFSEKELEITLSEIEDIDLRRRIKDIIILFIDDQHAKGLGLTLLQAPKGKQLYFTKQRD